jgi:RNA polymerase sigma factor (sigma-70 family)
MRLHCLAIGIGEQLASTRKSTLGARSTAPQSRARSMSTLQSDPELLAAYRDGCPIALAAVYRDHVRALDVYFRALARGAGAPELRQASVVQDLLQEAFIRAFSAPARRAYDGQRDFSPYLKAIARNCFIDAWRKRQLEARLIAFDAPSRLEGLAVSEEPPDPEMVATLERSLSELCPSLRQLYEARFDRGLSQEAACKALGLSRRSLRTLEARLRRDIRKALLDAERGRRGGQCRGAAEA